MTRDYEALAAYLDARSNVPFDWDANCCAKFCLGAIEAQFGAAPKLPFNWTSARGAGRVIKARGGMIAIMDSLFERIPAGMAMRGDIAGCPDDGLGVVLSIIDGQMLVGPCENGTRHIPRSFLSHAWRAAPEALNV